MIFVWSLSTSLSLASLLGADFCQNLFFVTSFGFAYDIMGSFGIAYFRYLCLNLKPVIHSNQLNWRRGAFAILTLGIGATFAQSYLYVTTRKKPPSFAYGLCNGYK